MKAKFRVKPSIKGIKVKEGTPIINKNGKTLYRIKAYDKNRGLKELHLLTIDNEVVKIPMDNIEYFFQAHKYYFLQLKNEGI